VFLAGKWRGFTGTFPLGRFGMTEIGVGVSNLLAGPRHTGCVGLPLPTVETRIVGEDGRDVADGESGELLIRGPSVFARYHSRPTETAAAFVDGWFRTGDTVVRERSLPDAPFKILGRTSVDILKSGGYKPPPPAIEEVPPQHPGTPPGPGNRNPFTYVRADGGKLAADLNGTSLSGEQKVAGDIADFTIAGFGFSPDSRGGTLDLDELAIFQRTLSASEVKRLAGATE